MKDKIYQYIKEKSIGIDSDEIIRVFFHINTSYPKQMLDIIEQMLSADQRFARDAQNRWTINQEIETLPLKNLPIAVVDTDSVQLDIKRTIPSLIGILICKNTELIFQKICEIDYPFDLSEKMQEQIQKQKEYLDVEYTTPENLSSLFHHLNQSLLFHTAPSRFIDMINQLFRKRIGMELELQSFPMGQLLKVINPNININSFENILDSFDIQHSEDMDLGERLQLRWAVIVKIIERLATMNITTRAQLEELLSEKNGYIDFSQFNFDESYIKSIPQNPGVYLMRSSEGAVFYVGKAKNLKNRLQNYFIKRSVADRKLQIIFEKLFELTFEETGSELEALLLENQYINSYRPDVNKQIDVNTDFSLQIEKDDVVVFQPALEPNFITVFFVNKSDKMFMRRLDRHDGNHKACESLLTMYFDNPIEMASDYSIDQIEIFWRWFWIHKDNVSHIKPGWYASSDELLKKISEYIADPDLLSQRVVHP